MNTTFSELLERFVPFVLDRCSLNNSYNIIDYDLDRVCLEVDGKPNTYVIRMWAITKMYIRFSMFEIYRKHIAVKH